MRNDVIAIDVQRIAGVIRQVWAHHAPLAAALAEQAEQFAYTAFPYAMENHTGSSFRGGA